MPEITEKDLPQAQKALWLRALSAIQTQNLPYAISIIQAILKDLPEFLDGRKILRKVEIQSVGGSKKKGGLFGGGGFSAMKYSGGVKKDPAGTIVALEKELEKDPLNEGANDLLFECFMKLEMPDSAAFALETVRKGPPETPKLLHKLAQHYLGRNMPQQAGEVYTDILKIAPTDSEAVKGAKDCAARASMQKAKWDENSNMRDLMRDQAQFEEMEKASRTGLTRDQLEERRDKIVLKYNEDTNHLGTVKELAGVYEQLEDWANAHAFYSWAHTLSNGDVALQNKASQMNDRANEAHMRSLEEAAALDPDNADLQAQLQERKAARLAEQVEEAKRRVEQNPTDPQLRFELGNALYNTGDYTSAIPHLQQATRNPHIRTKVLLLLGRTFKAKHMFDLAIKQLSDALSDLHAMDNTKKEVLYEKGVIHAEMGDQTSALDCFKQIYEVDYGYRDVAQRVESSYAG